MPDEAMPDEDDSASEAEEAADARRLWGTAAAQRRWQASLAQGALQLCFLPS